jgi:hypothetical protein
MLANLIVNITGKGLQPLPSNCLETVRGAASLLKPSPQATREA